MTTVELRLRERVDVLADRFEAEKKLARGRQRTRQRAYEARRRADRWRETALYWRDRALDAEQRAADAERINRRVADEVRRHRKAAA